MTDYIDKFGKKTKPEPSHFLAAAEFILMLRQKGIRDISVLRAMEQVARSAFLPEKFQDFADEDLSVPISYGQLSLKPSLLAKFCEILSLKPSDKVLCVGAGNGYFPALLSRLVDEVIVFERIKPLVEEAHFNLKQQGYDRINLLYGDGLEGYLPKAPYDKIIVTCSLNEKPQILLNQLAPEGLLLAPIGARQTQSLTLFSQETEKTFPLSLTIPKARKGVAGFVN